MSGIFCAKGSNFLKLPNKSHNFDFSNNPDFGDFEEKRSLFRFSVYSDLMQYCPHIYRIKPRIFVLFSEHSSKPSK